MIESRPKYPGVPGTTDGAGMVTWVDTHITQGACAYPITSSTTMGEGYERAVAAGSRNLWGEPLGFLEPESEHSSASACEGFALAGGRVSNFTSGQGLVLMKEVLFTISGKRLPVVFHIGARALTSQSLNVHAGHDDVMAVADTGWGMLFARNAQEAGDMALVARRAAEDSHTPFFNVQDGFLTTHTIQDVLMPEPELMAEYAGRPSEKLVNFFDPSTGLMTGVVQNQDSYMKGKIAQRFFYDRVPAVLEEAMREYGDLTGRYYSAVESYRMADAEFALVGMGSAMETAQVAVDWLREQRGWKVGLVNVRAFRPFPGAALASALAGVWAVTVLERVDVPLMQSNPLTAELKAALADAATGAAGYPWLDRIPVVLSGSAGLGGRDVGVGSLVAAFENMRESQPQRTFVLGIRHPLALEQQEEPNVRIAGSFTMRGHSVGGFGSIATNKVIATVAHDLFGASVQAFPRYGGEKKGLPTNYYLTVADEPIRTHCELVHVDFVPVNDMNAFSFGNPLAGLERGGTLFLQTSRRDPGEVWDALPPPVREEIAANGIRVLALDTAAIARKVASQPDLVSRMQGIVLLGVFLRVAPLVTRSRLNERELFLAVERSLRKYFGRRGEGVIKDNLECVKRGYHEVMEVPWRTFAPEGTALAAVGGA
ncbi:MAG: 2-oxoacid:acceptor oxidoreductase family protein [Chloroflexi bacterium]|nr:2-oxoacid:acceptor oxidoreductase family protein [Chloroflexota bacterium]